MLKSISKISIIFVLPSVRSGGAEKVMSLLVNNLNENQYNKTVILLDSRDAVFKFNPEVKLIKLEKYGIKNAIFAIYKIIKSSNVDVVFSSTMKITTALCYLKLVLPKNITWIGRESNISSLSYSVYYKYPLFMRWIAKFGYKFIDAIITQSQYMRDDLIMTLGIAGNNIIVINNPISVPNKESISQFSRTKVYLLSVGRLHPTKGYDRILKSLAQIKIDFEYHILGDGKIRKEIEDIIIRLGLSDKVILHGWVNNVNDYYSKASLLLMGSHHEGFPNVVLEAGLHGVPIVAYDCPGGTSEIIRHCFNGMLSSNDTQYLINLQDAIKYKWDHRAIRYNVIEKYNVAEILSKYDSVIKEIISTS